MTTTIQGRFGGQYSLSMAEEDPQRFKLRAQYPDISNSHTIFTGDYEVATKLMDYCALHDGLAKQAVSDLFYLGDPTRLIEMVEAAKDDPSARARRRVVVQSTIETDVLESEDAITEVSQRSAAAFRMCGVTVRHMEVEYVGRVPQGVGIEFVLNALEQALMIQKYPTGELLDELRSILLPKPPIETSKANLHIENPG